MDDLSNFFKNLLQNVKRFLLQIKNRIPNLRWQLQNNKPLAFLCIAVLGILLFSSLKGLVKSSAHVQNGHPVRPDQCRCQNHCS